METPHPDRLLSAEVFFDLRPAAGDETVGHALWEWVCDRAPSHGLFLRYLARATLERRPPLGVFGRFAVKRSGDHKGTFDIKAHGMFPITQAMRVHALSLGLRETNTADRLRQLGERGIFAANEVGELRDAYEVIFRVRLTHQLGCLDAGLPPDNLINPQSLGKSDRLLLKEAFKSLAWLQRELEDRFQTRALP
jgi:CBS domain-containing protein